MSAAYWATMLLGLPLLQPRQAPPAHPEGVWIDFRNGEDSHGLEYMEAFQCPHKLTQIDGVGCAQTIPPGGLYLQFQAPRDMIVPGRDTLTFETEVYDGDPHFFMLQVESTTPSVAPAESYFRTLPTVQRHNTKEWRWVRWQVTDPAFCDPARDAIRFRFYDEAWWNDGRLLSISQVRVTHEALVFRPQQDAVLAGQRLPITVEAYDKTGQPLPDGTEVKLASRPGPALTERPPSVILKGGKADFEVTAGPKPDTVLLSGLPAGARAWVTKPIFILAGQGKLEERTDLVTGEELAATARFDSDSLAESKVSTFTDDKGQVALRGTCVWKPNVAPSDVRLILNVPFAGVPRRFRVRLGCPDRSVDTAAVRIKDRDGELFPYILEQRGEGTPLPVYAERGLECRAVGGPSYMEGGGTTDGIIDLPCSLFALYIAPMPGCHEAEIDVWAVETDVLGPSKGEAAPPKRAVGQPATAEPAPAQPNLAGEQHYQRGLEFKRAGNLTSAADEFRAAIAADPKHAKAHYALGWVLLDQKDKTGAAAELRKVIEVAPDSEEAKEAQKALDRVGP